MGRFSALIRPLLRQQQQQGQFLRPISTRMISLFSPSPLQLAPSTPFSSLSVPATAACLYSSFPPSSRSFSSTSESTSNMILVKSENHLSESLQKATDESSPAIFYFTAEWCGPCRFLWPDIKKLSESLPDVTFYKIDIDEVGSGPTVHISSVPTLHFFKDGKKAAEVVGADSRKIRDITSSLYKWKIIQMNAMNEILQSLFPKQVRASVSSCCVGGFEKNGAIEMTEVADALWGGRKFKVVFNVETKDAECTCKMFERKGIFCKHIIYVLSGKLSSIPEKYILSRWTRTAYRRKVFDEDGKILDDYDATDIRKVEMSKVWSEFYATISIVSTMPDNHITELHQLLKNFRLKVDPEQASPPSKEKEIEKLLGCKPPTEVNILPPYKAKNKGGGKRLLSTKKQAIQQARRQKRLCANCKKMAHHDKRNCPNPFSEQAPPTGEEEEDDEDEQEDEEEDEEEVEDERTPPTVQLQLQGQPLRRSARRR